MQFIITGGTGLIGRSFIAQKLSSGDEFIVLTRNPSNVRNLPKSVRIEKWDALTQADWGHLINNKTIIINLAGASVIGDGLVPSRWTKERKQIYSS